MAKGNKNGGIGTGIVVIFIIGLAIFYGYIALIVAVIALIIFLIYRHSKKKKAEEATTQYKKSPEYQNKIKYGYEEEKQKVNHLKNSKALFPVEVKIYNKDMGYFLPQEIIFTDTETTGLKSNDEILELAIVNYDGDVLFNKRFKPKHRRKGEEAEKIHGISPADVKDLPTIEEYREELEKIFNNKVVVGYNIDFDYRFIVNEELITGNYRTVDVMKAYAIQKKEWAEWKNEYKGQKLVDCAKAYNYEGTGKAHGALADTQATAYCFKKMKNCSIVRWQKR